MKLGDKYVWVDTLDQTVDNEVLVYIGNEGSYHNFGLDGGEGGLWVGLEEDELAWIKIQGE